MYIMFMDKNQCTESSKSGSGYKSKCWNVKCTRNFNTEAYNILEQEIRINGIEYSDGEIHERKLFDSCNFNWIIFF